MTLAIPHAISVRLPERLQDGREEAAHPRRAGGPESSCSCHLEHEAYEQARLGQPSLWNPGS